MRSRLLLTGPAKVWCLQLGPSKGWGGSRLDTQRRWTCRQAAVCRAWEHVQLPTITQVLVLSSRLKTVCLEKRTIEILPSASHYWWVSVFSSPHLQTGIGSLMEVLQSKQLLSKEAMRNHEDTLVEFG